MVNGQKLPWQELIDQIGEFAGSLGLSRSVGQLYAALYMSPEPMSLDDLAQACEMSKGNVCLNIRQLEQWGAARRVWVRGDRKDYYEANRDVRRIAMRRFKEGMSRRLNILEEALGDASQQIEQLDSNPKEKAFFRERLDEIQKLYRSSRRVLDNLERLYEIGKRFL